MKRFVTALSLCCLFITMAAQNDIAIAEKIKNNRNYLYGDGYGTTYAEADKNALANLISKIAITLNNSFSSCEEEVSSSEGQTGKTAVRSVVNSYTQATLTRTNSLTLSNEPDAHVMRYISQAELDKVFAQRKDKVDDMIRSAQRAEQKGKIDDALRYYYWSFSLVKSLQYPNDVVYNDNGENRKLMVWIPEKINEILDQLNVRISDVNGNEATLFFTYKGNPVISLDFTFFNGNGWTMLNSVKNGIASIETKPGVNINNLKIHYEYEYTGETQIDSEIASVVGLFKGTYFRHAETSLVSGASSLKSAISKDAKAERTNAISNMKETTMTTVSDSKPYEKIIEKIVAAIKKGDYKSIKPLFTDEGWTMMDGLLNYGKAKLLGKQEFAFYNTGDNRVTCRSLAMSFAFPNNHRTFTEDVTFTFDSSKKIETVAFGLGVEAKTDIFDKGIGVWSDTSKLAIATFLEDYKTAFALKRIDYIKSIFDDHAVIITGHVVKRNENQPTDGKTDVYGSSPLVEYNRLTKDEYIKKLDRCFKSNEFVNIRFTDNDVVKMGIGGEVYGIQIHQDYFSSHYGDTGYLFLLVDVNDSKKPIIKVRTWQPERDPNINGRLPRNHRDYGIIGPGNF